MQIESKANIVLISFYYYYYYYYIRIAGPNTSLKTTVHYLLLIFTFFELKILMKSDNLVDVATTVLCLYTCTGNKVSILTLI